MLDGDSVIQAEGDIYIIREKRQRRKNDRLVLSMLMFFNVMAWGLVLWMSTGHEARLREMVISEVPVQVRLILLP